MEIWQILLLLSVVSIVVEIFTSGLVAGAVGVGFLLSAFGAMLNAPIEIQAVLFSIGTICGFIAIKKLIKDRFQNKPLKTNVDAMVGQSAKAVSDIDKLGGEVVLDGTVWKAISSEERIEKGSIVKILSIESIVLLVTKI